MKSRLVEWDRWVRVRPQVQRNLLIEAEGVRLVRYRLAPGFSVPLHSHRGAQIGVILAGNGIHRFVLQVERNRRTRRVTTELPVRAGDCFYIPPDTPHSFAADARRPAVMIDIMVHPRASTPTAHSATVAPRRLRTRRSRRGTRAK